METRPSKPCPPLASPARILPVLVPSIDPGGQKYGQFAPCRNASAISLSLLSCPPAFAVLFRFAKAVLFADCGGIGSALELFQLLAWAEEVHQGGKAALSCRLCLIACNSRQFDELELGRD